MEKNVVLQCIRDIQKYSFSYDEFRFFARQETNFDNQIKGRAYTDDENQKIEEIIRKRDEACKKYLQEREKVVQILQTSSRTRKCIDLIEEAEKKRNPSKGDFILEQLRGIESQLKQIEQKRENIER